jgi:hypothetical protein
MNQPQENEREDVLMAQLGRMSDAQAVLSFQTFERRRLQGARYDPAAVIRGFPSQEVGAGPETLLQWSGDDGLAVVPINETMTVRAARFCLEAAAELPALRPFVQGAVDRPSDDLLSAGLVTRLGRLAALLMLLASTDFSIDFGPVVIHKERLTPESIAALSNLIATIRGSLPSATETTAHPRTPPPGGGAESR